MIYKLKDGDVVKILPILTKKGGFLTIEELKGFYIGNKIIYDTSDGILRKALTNKLYKEDSYNNLYRQQVNRLALCIYHEGEINLP